MITISTKLADGRSVSVSGQVNRAEPDVGLMSSWTEEITIEEDDGTPIDVDSLDESEIDRLSDKLIEAAENGEY